MPENWSAVAAEVADAIESVGFTATLHRPGVENGPDYDPVIGPETLIPVTVIDEMIRRRDGNGMVTETVRVLTVAATGVTPEKGWGVTVRGVYHRIARVMPLAPGGTDVLFEVELEG